MNNKTRLLACAATLLMAVCVMPKPAPTPELPAFEIGCSSPNGGESCVVVNQVLSEDMAYPACWEEDQVSGPCVWDARDNGGISYFLEADGSVSLLEFP